MSKMNKEQAIQMKAEAEALIKENEYRRKVLDKMLEVAKEVLKKFK